MKICLAQTFPLGRFHATPWKVFPYDDPHGGWPPSPWRLLRALLARSHQLERENGNVTDAERVELVQAFARSEIAWHLPDFSWRGPGLRQYQPAEFKKVPAAAKEPGMMSYNTTKVQDNFWLTGGTSQPLFWYLDGENWTASTLSLLDACLSRLTYFGRAESVTEMARSEIDIPEVNCRLKSNDSRRGVDDSQRLVPVLCPLPEVTLEQLQMTTDEKALRNSTFPPGAIWRCASRPRRPAAKPRPSRPKKNKPPVSFLQFAVGSRVSPNSDHIALLTNRFRGRVISGFLIREFDTKGGWPKAGPEAREAVALLAGKNAYGNKLRGHQHAYFAIWIDPQTQKPARLLAWRTTPFDEPEQRAILAAANNPLALGYNKVKGKYSGGDPWTVQLVPLDSTVLRPAGFSAEAHREWATMTPYVPPRHVVDRRGKIKPGESVEEQLRQELELHDLPVPDLKSFAVSEESQWVKVHGAARSEGQRSNLSKRGFEIRMTFPEPIRGPLALGHSAHFGLGLFVPVRDETL